MEDQDVPVLAVVRLRSSPPNIRIILLHRSAVRLLLRFCRAADELNATETVDTARQQHPIIMEIHATVAA